MSLRQNNLQKWHRCRREAANISNWFIPWEQKIKAIESHFGSAVASYFIFLRWLFWVNVVIAFAIMAFVAIPEVSFIGLWVILFIKIYTLNNRRQCKHIKNVIGFYL